MGKLLAFIVLGFFFLSFVGAQTTDFIKDEKLIAAPADCSDTQNFQEVVNSRFVDGSGIEYRHCVIKAPFENAINFVSSSYLFKVTSGPDCPSGNNQGFFNDVDGAIVILCVEYATLGIGESGDITNDVLISNDCGNLAPTEGNIYLGSNDFINHCRSVAQASGGEPECFAEGNYIPTGSPNQCCSGLTKIPPISQDINNLEICTALCGNGVCNPNIESNYNCPADCTTVTAECALSTPQWLDQSGGPIETAFVGEDVLLSVSAGDGCVGADVDFEIWDDDTWTRDDRIDNAEGVTNIFRVSWLAKIVSDEIFAEPYYYFKVFLEGVELENIGYDYLTVIEPVCESGNEANRWSACALSGECRDAGWFWDGNNCIESEDAGCDNNHKALCTGENACQDDAGGVWIPPADGEVGSCVECTPDTQEDKCSSNEVCESNVCVDDETPEEDTGEVPDCVLNGAKWVVDDSEETIVDPVKAGEGVNMLVRGNEGCYGEEINFEIKLDEPYGDSEDLDVGGGSAVMNNDGFAIETWAAEFPEDEEGEDVQYYFYADVVGDASVERVRSSPDLYVELEGDKEESGETEDGGIFGVLVLAALVYAVVSVVGGGPDVALVAAIAVPLIETILDGPLVGGILESIGETISGIIEGLFGFSLVNYF